MVQLRTLGTLELTRTGDGDVSANLIQPKRLALLVYLATARPRGFHRRDTLLALFWPELDEQHARGALSQGLLHLRWVVGAGVVVSRGTNEVGVDPTRLWCDVAEFEARAAVGDAERALELYRGDFLQGVHLSGLLEFERWVEAERAKYRAVATRAAWMLAEREEKAGRTATAADWARTATALTLNDEVAVRRQIELLARVGDHAGAIAAYEAFARRLEADYETEPSAETRAIIGALRSRTSGEGGSPNASGFRRADAESHDVTSRPFDQHVPDPIHPPDPGVLPTARARPRHTRRVIGGLGILGGLAVLGVAIFGARSVPSRADTRASSAAARIAVFPFTYRGNGQFRYLGEGMVDLLSVALDGAGDLKRVDPYTLLSVVNRELPGVLDPEHARAMIGRFNADLFVLGSVVSADTQIIVSASLYDARTNGEPLGVAQQRGPAIALPSLIDALAAELLRDRLQHELSGGSQQAVVATRTTTSLVALKAYLTGERLLRTAHYDDAARAYEAALIADSTFALAYFRLAVALSDGARSSFGWSMLDALERATRHNARLAQRDRAVLAAVDAFWRRRDPDHAIQLLRGVIQQYPDDFEAWWRLGEMEFHHGMRSGHPLEQVRATLSRASELDSATTAALIERRWLANAEENAAEDERLSRRMLALAPAGDFHPLLEVNIALLAGERAEALKILESMRNLRGLVRLLCVEAVAMHSDDVELVRKAATLLTSVDNTPAMRVAGHKIVAHVQAARGQWSAAKRELVAMQGIDADMALETLGILSLSPAAPQALADIRDVRQRLTVWTPAGSSDSVRRLYLLGLLAARIGDHSDALSKARAMETESHRLLRLDSASRLGAEARDRAWSVRAQSAWLRGSAGEALRYLQMARPEKWWGTIANGDLFGNWAYERFMRAEVLSRLGREAEATNWYSELRLTQYELVFDPVVNMRLGEMAERRGDVTGATQHFRKVIAKWAKADPEVPPYHTDARAALGRLATRVSGATVFNAKSH